MRRFLTGVLAGAAVLAVGWHGAPPASAADNDHLVQAWYRVYLERSAADAAGDPGRLYWTNRLNDGDTRESVLHDILVSREYVQRDIADYYSRFLARGLDPGARYWVDGVVRGDFVAEWAGQQVAASDEYYRTWTSGATDADAQFIRTLYFDLLGRSAAGAEVEYWRGVLAREGRLALVRGIWYADEGVVVRLDRNYRTVLGRSADAGGRSYWTPIERNSDHVVRYRLGSTDEFVRNRAT